MSFWLENDLTPKVLDILARFEPEPSLEPFGRPFMTSLQLAFEFQKTYPGIVRLLGFEAGGTEVRDQNSLAHYLANELFTRISTGRITEVEGASLSSAFLNQLSYQHQGTPFDSSVKLGSYDLALFRLK